MQICECLAAGKWLQCIPTALGRSQRGCQQRGFLAQQFPAGCRWRGPYGACSLGSWDISHDIRQLQGAHCMTQAMNGVVDALQTPPSCLTRLNNVRHNHHDHDAIAL